MENCLSSFEEWKPIPQYDGLYEASNLGRIRTAVGKTTHNARFSKRVWKQRVLKPKSSKIYRGDSRVTLWKDGIRNDYLVSRLIAMTWVDGYEENLTVNHIDGNYKNNASSNLEWVSREQNIKLGFETGLYDSIMKKVRLTDDSGSYLDFNSMSEASRYLGRCVAYISNSVKKERFYVFSKYGEAFHVSVL